MNLHRISEVMTLGTMVALTAITATVALVFEPAVPPAPVVPVQLETVEILGQRTPIVTLPTVVVENAR
ncbi:hypothetical protein HNQ51_002141 [Inhella inkyongensis]|uniref:Uncharacterized protein n=1 Tax=Inhella inkyongensis TaxID=392593 RepID=A0A840S140_9BURK|nr:hypothetical protein [Inhella inkyongensis]MBB5204827.1 hypothetical protein [Inhella inkyongensis]